MLENLADAINSQVAFWTVLLGSLAAVVVWVRKGWQKLSELFRRFSAVADTLGGREAITHPDTGRELVAATPGIGERLAAIEDSQARMAEALHTLSAEQSSLAMQSALVDNLRHEFGAVIQAKEDDHRRLWAAIEAIKEES